MIELKTPYEIDKMATTGRFVASTLNILATQAEPGVNLLDLEYRARKLLDDRSALSCYWDYSPPFGRGPFRNVICLSVNDAVLHGLPHDYVLRDGDLLSLDLAVSIDGWVADAAVTIIIGSANDADSQLVKSTRQALSDGIAAAVPGGHLEDISAAIAAAAASSGYQINADFGGHGLGRTMHEDPHVPNCGRRGRGVRLRPGMTLALEPWWARGTNKIVTDPDGWTIRAADGTMAAHSEHTIAITETGPRILTING